MSELADFLDVGTDLENLKAFAVSSFTELFNFTSILEEQTTKTVRWSSLDNQSKFNIYKQGHPTSDRKAILIWSLIDQLEFDIQEVIDIIDGHKVNNIQSFLFVYRSIQLGLPVGNNLSPEIRAQSDPTNDEQIVALIQDAKTDNLYELSSVYDCIAFLGSTEISEVVENMNNGSLKAYFSSFTEPPTTSLSAAVNQINSISLLAKDNHTQNTETDDLTVKSEQNNIRTSATMKTHNVVFCTCHNANILECPIVNEFYIVTRKPAVAVDVNAVQANVTAVDQQPALSGGNSSVKDRDILPQALSAASTIAAAVEKQEVAVLVPFIESESSVVTEGAEDIENTAAAAAALSVVVETMETKPCETVEESISDVSTSANRLPTTDLTDSTAADRVAENIVEFNICASPTTEPAAAEDNSELYSTDIAFESAVAATGVGEVDSENTTRSKDDIETPEREEDIVLVPVGEDGGEDWEEV